MSPFKNGALYWCWVPRSDRRWVRVSCGTGDRKTANAIKRMVGDLTARARTDILDAVADHRLRLLDVFGEFRTDATVAESAASLDDLDLAPLVEEWHRALVQRGTVSADRYRTHVRALIPADVPFPRSGFRRKAISTHLSGLDVTGSTVNRHRAALSQFGKWLVEREILEHNPVRDVRSAKENAPRTGHYTSEEVQALIKALPQPYRALEAIMAGTGMEWSAVAPLRRRDVDAAVDTAVPTIRARGAKNPWRNRTCVVTEAWTLPLIRGHVAALTPNALLFDGIRHEDALDTHADACTAAKLPHTTLHDHRHHYAVNAIKQGMPVHLVAAQLGHKDATLVQRIYGKFAPQAENFRRFLKATTPARGPRKTRRKLS